MPSRSQFEVEPVDGNWRVTFSGATVWTLFSKAAAIETGVRAADQHRPSTLTIRLPSGEIEAKRHFEIEVDSEG